MTYIAVSDSRWRHKPYVAFSGALVEYLSELDMLCQMWAQLVTPRHDRTFYDYDYGILLATFALTWHCDLNMIKLHRKFQNSSKRVIQGQIWP